MILPILGGVAALGALGYGIGTVRNYFAVTQHEKDLLDDFKRIKTHKIQFQEEEANSEDLDLMNMRHYWYPVCCVEDVTNKKPFGVELFGEPLALYRNPKSKKMNCVADRCPHRGAPLSVGDIDPETGDLRCLYHGWEFGNDGQATKIPSLAPESGLKKCICVKSYPAMEFFGYVWVFPNINYALAEKAKIQVWEPSMRFLMENEYKTIENWAHYELPIKDIGLEHGILLENLMDYAHIDFTHNKYIGKFEWASEVKMGPGPELPEYLKEAFKSIPDHVFRSKYSMPESKNKARKNGGHTDLTFIPPCFIKIENHLGDGPKKKFFQILMMPPLNPKKTTLFIKFFFGFFPKFVTYMPLVKYFVDKNNVTILHQDLKFILGIQDNVNNKGMKIHGALVPADKTVKSYRKWRTESETHSDPWFKSWSGDKRKHVQYDPKDIEDLLK